ncbi:MAG: hypothetical protein Q7S58_02760 [Candidatus Binatus sp.]|uniref:hypothetical protein n=1 Tax=Candidatus Binatus sp. TaxID=2811406 RepID=UPI00271D66A2|nr:hypothetical protein [Candidatus Binatus sp.]MDO8431313.1 hypothetical protein [Candidatus Binatus sp.]
MERGPELSSGASGEAQTNPGSGYTDLLGVDIEGNVLIVETKLAKNPEVRRKVIGQILEYAAYLWTISYDQLDALFLAKEGKPIAELWRLKTSEPLPDGFREIVTANLRSGIFNLFIAVDEMNEQLEKIIAYVSSRGPGLKLQALELRTYKLGDLEILAPQRHGEFVQTSTAAAPASVTIEEALANCPDEHSRQLFKLLIDLLVELGHEVRPGQVGLAFRADVNGTKRSIFWASRGDLQGAFNVNLENGAPVDAVQAFRSAVSKLPGFDSSKFLHAAQPIVKLSKLTESEVERFVKEADTVVRVWREASQIAGP